MKSRQLILRDLLTSRSTADAIKDHTGIPLQEIQEILADEEIAGTVETRPLGPLTIWQLTALGDGIAATFPRPPQYP
jgi:predicted Rossmann fold nucleotide-binding protein DprA/Smf involved in DNA uptake